MLVHMTLIPTRLSGLTQLEAAAQLKRVGPNLLRPALQRAVALQFLTHFRNPLVLILLAASAISACLPWRVAINTASIAGSASTAS